MIRTLTSRASIVVFGVSLAAIYAVAASIVVRLGQLENPDVIAGALTLDLTLLVPLLYYLLLARPRGWPPISVLPVFLVSFLIAERLIPEARQQVLDIVSYGAVLAEVTLLAVIGYKTLQLRRGFREKAAAGMGVYESLRESAAPVVGPFAGGVLAYEVAVFYYAIAGWSRSAELGEKSFSVYRNTAYIALMIAAMIALVIETTAVHLLLRLWSPVAAWVLTAISLYTFVWLLGDIHAVRLRPVRVCGDTLQLRLGLRWTASVPLGSIRDVENPHDAEPLKRRGYLKAVLVGAPNRRLRLTEPARAVGLYGLTRQVTTIDLHIDDPHRFDAALGQGGPLATVTQGSPPPSAASRMTT